MGHADAVDALVIQTPVAHLAVGASEAGSTVTGSSGAVARASVQTESTAVRARVLGRATARVLVNNVAVIASADSG